MSGETWLAFFAASWAISLSPGAGAVAAMSSGLRHGLRHGYWNTIGLQLGLLLQLAVVAAGVGSLLATSRWGFESVRWFGVAYLCWLGWRSWNAPARPIEARGGAGEESAAALIRRGFVVNAANPKATVFMLAVLPQFIDPARPLPGQYALITLTMVAVDMIVMAGYTGLAARVLRLLREPAHLLAVNRAFGGMFVAAAALLALFRRGDA